MKKNRIIYLLLLFLSYIFINLYNGKVPYIFFYTLLILPAVSLIYTLAVFLSFKFYQDIDKKTAIKGEKVNFYFNVINENVFLYPYVRTNFYGSDTIFADQFISKCYSLSPYKKVSFSMQLECRYRGFYRIGIKSFEFEDLLGLFKLKYQVNQEKQITVYPRIVTLDRFFLNTNYISDSHSLINSGSEDMTSVSDIRKYRYGDNFKRIHWKHTARMQELYVKNFHSTSESNATVFLDVQSTCLPIEHKAIVEDMLVECVVAVTNYCLTNWFPVNFIYLRSELNKQNSYRYELVSVTGKNPLDFELLYKTLSKISFSDNVALNDVLDLYMTDNYKRTNIIIFTANLNYDLFNQMHKIKSAGHELSLVYVSPEMLSGKNPDAESILEFLPEINVRSYKININDDIKEKLER